MPNTPNTRYTEAVSLRDAGHTYESIAQLMNYAHAGAARRAVINGLMQLGRESEIPAGRAVSFRTGRTTRTITVDDLQGFTTLSSLTFGIEIECIGLDTYRAARALTDNGYACANNGYTHDVMRTWKVVTDGSLSSRSGSCEVVSPPLRGNDGLNEIRSVMKVLRDAGARVNVSCGMHIHIGVDSLTQEQQANLIKAHQRFQPAWDALLTERRVDNQRWAKRRTIDNADRLATMWATSSDVRTISRQTDRYHALNINSFYKYGTFEFRLHHGSLNGKNATAWIALHLAFIAAVINDAEGMTRPLYDNIVESELGHFTDHHQRYTDSGYALPVESRRAACVSLVAKLEGMGVLAADAADFLRNRAGNVPSNSRSTNV